MTQTNSQIKDEISSIFVKWSLPTRQIAINEIIKLLDSLLKQQREEIFWKGYEKGVDFQLQKHNLSEEDLEDLENLIKEQ